MSETTMVVNRERFEQVRRLHEDVQSAKDNWKECAEDAKDAKKKYDHKVELFETAFARLANSPDGVDMPLFNQSDVVEAAQAPDIKTLTDRLHAQGIEIVTPLIVAGYTDEERQTALAWLNDCDRIKAEQGENLTMDHLPLAPDFLLGPLAEIPGESPDVAAMQTTEAEVELVLDELEGEAVDPMGLPDGVASDVPVEQIPDDQIEF